MSELYPSRPKSTPVESPCAVSQFDTAKQDTLGVQRRGVQQILAGCLEEFVAKGLL